MVNWDPGKWCFPVLCSLCQSGHFRCTGLHFAHSVSRETMTNSLTNCPEVMTWLGRDWKTLSWGWDQNNAGRETLRQHLKQFFLLMKMFTEHTPHPICYHILLALGSDYSNNPTVSPHHSATVLTYLPPLLPDYCNCLLADLSASILTPQSSLHAEDQIVLWKCESNHVTVVTSYFTHGVSQNPYKDL